MNMDFLFGLITGVAVIVVALVFYKPFEMTRLENFVVRAKSMQPVSKETQLLLPFDAPAPPPTPATTVLKIVPTMLSVPRTQLQHYAPFPAGVSASPAVSVSAPAKKRGRPRKSESATAPTKTRTTRKSSKKSTRLKSGNATKVS